MTYRAHITYPTAYVRKGISLNVSNPLIADWVRAREPVRIYNRPIVTNNARAEVEEPYKHEGVVIAVPGMQVHGRTLTASFMWDGENIYIKHSTSIGWHRPRRDLWAREENKHPAYHALYSMLQEKGIMARDE